MVTFQFKLIFDWSFLFFCLLTGMSLIILGSSHTISAYNCNNPTHGEVILEGKLELSVE